jgi:CRISPR-associated protein (TIGR03985 family)
MRIFNHRPTPEVLQALVKPAQLCDGINNVKKAVRTWYVMRYLSENLDIKNFNIRGWLDSFYEDFPKDVNSRPNQVDGCISNKTIKEILFGNEGNSTTKRDWEEWELSFSEFYRKNKGGQELAEPLKKAIRSECPFYITGKAFGDNLQASNFISYNNGIFIVLDEFPDIISNSQTSELADTECIADFDSYVNMFSKKIKGVQRFYINSDDSGKEQTNLLKECQDKLLKSWASEKTLPLQITYRSAYANQVIERIIYPVSIHYYQRGFYLSALSKLESSSETQYHNYRMDRIQKMDILEWGSEKISQELHDKCYEADDNNLVDEIRNKLEEAYGFDFFQDQATMIIRFKRDFNDRFIKNTFRHETFDAITIEDTQEFLLGNYPDLLPRLDEFPNDAYYTMEYRLNDNTVIMRLRAWGQAVEVLSPASLRQRLKDDSRETSALYETT